MDRTELLARIAAEEARVAELEAQRAETQRCLDALRGQLLDLPEDGSGKAPPKTSSEKVALFRSLFRGRPDVFPKLWRNARSQKEGYSPACANEWVQGICDKPKVKCGECPNQAFLPVSDGAILDHLWGRQTVGVYLLLPDETCWLLAMDFDEGEWRKDVAALRETCQELGVPIAVERSRSGKGAHVWFFFTAPVSASVARRMGSHLIAETMARRPELPMGSYDRLFPNQDTMPRGGFGNLIALPFQYEPRKQGNSVFVQEDWSPCSDQWKYLAGYSRLEPSRVQEIARRACESGLGPGLGTSAGAGGDEGELDLRRSSLELGSLTHDAVPDRVRVTLAGQLLIETQDLPPALVHQIKQLATFQNPEFHRKQAMRLSVARTPRVISCAEEAPGKIGLPRGCLRALEEILGAYRVKLEIDDQRTSGELLEAGFHGELTHIQGRAARVLLAHDAGVLVAPPGSGKTVVGTYLVSQRGRNTLVLVHRTQLLEQWRTQLSVFLDLRKSAIGQIGGGRRKATGSIDVAMIQSLARGKGHDDTVARYGHVIVDECHHVPAVSFEAVMRKVQARYITGLTATPQRRDGLQPILAFQIGPVHFTVDRRSQGDGQIARHQLIPRYTGFSLSPDDMTPGIQEVYSQLVANRARNDMILDDVIGALEQGRSPLLLTERREHIAYLADRLENFARHLVVLQGGMGTRQRRAAMEQMAGIPDDEERLVLATGRFIGEGFDDARLDTLFLALPVSWRGTLVQYAGRLHRQHKAKTEVCIYDYVDRHVPVLARMFEKRLKGYRAMGYVHDPAAEPAGAAGDDYVIEYDEEAQQPRDARAR